ncbi:MAG: hypothetical protein JWP37_2278 [Mucilaginibacter sp.]|nr:hypothetical protein [Mucilaginibacter sp.]
MKKNLYKSTFFLKIAVLKALIILLVTATAMAQTNPAVTVVKGKVTDGQTNETLIGVTVTVKGTSLAVTTDLNGAYTISAGATSTLVFSYIGYKPQQIVVGPQTVINIKLLPSDEQLKDVVVTALNIKRERRSLGYSVTEVKGATLTEARETNFVNGLEGKVAGVNVSNVATGPGGSSNVVIRGISDITGSNQPLYVIDGIPMQNDTYAQTDVGGGYGGADGGDGTININPDDIETISILKGSAASALYGYRGSKGVILITTKSGKNAKGSGVEFNSNYVMQKVIDNTDWQKTYGQGSDGVKPIDASSAFELGLSAWGPKLDGTEVYQFDGVKRPYSLVNGNMGRFYKDGGASTNSVSFSKNLGDDGSLRFSASDLHNTSIIPNAGFQQQSFSLSTNYKLGKRLDLQLKGQYINAFTHNRPSVSDAPGSLNFAPLFLPPNVNITSLAPGYKADGSENQFLDDAYTTNPYFVANKFINNTRRNRFIGSADLKYTFDDGLYLEFRAGEDYFADRNTNITPNGTAYQADGAMTEENRKSTELNIDAIIGKKFKITKDFNLSTLVGVNSRKSVVDDLVATGTNFQTPFLYTVGNLGSPTEYESNPIKVNKSIYGTFDFSYKNYLYLGVTGRNDWYSTLAPGKTNYFYPSINGSFVFSELLHANWLDMGKLRLGYANVGGEADDPYQTLLGYNNIGNLNGHPVGNISNPYVPNAKLEPSSAKEFEIGTELDFFKGRLHFDIAYYNKKESREIIPAVTSETSGYNAVLLNSGTIQNKGIEFLVSGVPVKTKDFSWTETINITYNDNKVLSLSSGSTNYPLGYSRAGEDEGVGVAYMSQALGKSAYQIFVADPARDANGKIILDPATGAPEAGTNYVDVGSGIDPWSTGITSEFRYKAFNFSFLIDGKFGAKIFSGTNYYGYQFGLSKLTLPGRGQMFGADQTEFPQDYYNLVSNANPAIFVYDASFIKFRQIIFGYSFPASIFNNKIQSLTLSFVARNVFTIMKHTPNIDPESNYSNGPQGIEQAEVPYTRTFGLNLNVKF